MSERKEASAPLPLPAAPPPGISKRKVTLYFSSPMLAETQHEAIRQDRSISWIVQAAWRRARDEIRRLPAMKESEDESTAAKVDQDCL